MAWGPTGIATGAISEVDGQANMAVIQNIPDWESDYPAFKWCADQGTGWYLPTSDEWGWLRRIILNFSTAPIGKDAFFANYAKAGGTSFAADAKIWFSEEIGEDAAYYYEHERTRVAGDLKNIEILVRAIKKVSY